ncbi:MAG TPA: DUF3524 domain-containing protein [Tepidisphaeraceae bacterium]|jgi:hypothetical protein|nr:DUF3524 domain-containing protein [Tepidisphaeraceae bacterium]
MTRQLDILALEPFYGGIRRVMLETVIHCSRHRWTLLKLPPRRIERRLTTAAVWFSEQLSRHWVGRTDLLFTSEAMNLSDLYRFMPNLLKVPSVVYFHDNQLPPVESKIDGPLDLINLNTAAAATEIWFNSLYHLKTFLGKASALVKRHPELAGRNPLPDITGKARVMTPPVGFSQLHDVMQTDAVERDRRTIFVETRDADNNLLNGALAILKRRSEDFRLVTVGPVDELTPDLPRTTLPENDPNAHLRGLMESKIFISTRKNATADHHAVRALAAGCWPLFPKTGMYRELLPQRMHSSCLYDCYPEELAGHLQDVWHFSPPDSCDQELADILHQFDPVVACRAIDERVEQLAAIKHHGSSKG